MENGRPSLGPLFAGLWLAVVALGGAYGIAIGLVSLIGRSNRVAEFVNDICTLSLLSTIWYGIGRCAILLPRWRPAPISVAYAPKRVLPAAVNFIAVSIGAAPAGLLLAIAGREQPILQWWHWLALLIGLVGGHLAWLVADRYVARIAMPSWFKSQI